MKRNLFTRLAVSGMVKNKKIYIPYILSSIGMIMMYYIIHFLSLSPYVRGMAHGGDVGLVLSLGKFVIAVFSLIFLFYTNAFLVRKRNVEFGLYNVLGMNKKKIARIILKESFFSAVISIASGTALGMIFSKLAELGLLKMTQSQTGYGFNVSWKATLYTVIIYSVIFAILAVKSLITVYKAKPAELLKSDIQGEKPVKANPVVAIIGTLLIAGAYYMAVSIENPLNAIFLFFVAVIMVVIGTYMLFISGSVFLCGILQKNKKFFYDKRHFIAVSSMKYRMKRNGAGLASVCILSTMVLVMISSTASLYFGKNDAMKVRYPRNAEISVKTGSIGMITEENTGEIRKVYEDVFKEKGFTPKNVSEYTFASITGRLESGCITPDPGYDNYVTDFSKVRVVYFVSLDEYNRETGSDVKLEDGQALLHTLRCRYDEKTVAIGDLTLKIAGKTDRYVEIGEASSLIMPSLMLVIPDYDVLETLDSLESYGMKMLDVEYHYAYDSDESDEKTLEIFKDQRKALVKYIEESGKNYSFSYGCLTEEKADFFSTFGGLFFLGIILSVVFIFAAAVIIYYKQITEGYEDRKRFEIMKNIGMKDKDIRKTINSQIRIVFFAPLIAAGIHLCFAFPFIWKILMMFNMRNLGFVIMITAAAFVIFGIFYAMIYAVTARAYYKIVSPDGD